MSYQVAECYLTRRAKQGLPVHSRRPGKCKVTASRSEQTSQSQPSRLSGTRTQCVPSISKSQEREDLPEATQDRQGHAERPDSHGAPTQDSQP